MPQTTATTTDQDEDPEPEPESIQSLFDEGAGGRGAAVRAATEPRIQIRKDGGVNVQPLPSEGSPGPGLVQGLCEARKNIDTVPKNGWNDFLSHEYATYDDVMAAVGPALAEAGVWTFESVLETRYVEAPDSSSGGAQLRLVMIAEVLWTDGETEYKSRWVGTSIDSEGSDKHEYKLYSQLLKYAYAKTLKIETGDPDIDDASAAQGKDQPSGTPREGGAGNGDDTPGSITPKQLDHVRSEARKGNISLNGQDPEELSKSEASTLLDEAWS